MTLKRWRRLAATLVGGYSMHRLMHIAVSVKRNREAARLRGVRPSPEPWWPAIVGLHVTMLSALAVKTARARSVPPPSLLAPSLAALTLAAALRAWSSRHIRDGWNARVIAPAQLVTTGPYRFIRHPSYAALIVEMAALPLALGSPALALAATLANAAVLSKRIPFEERELARSHPGYEALMRERPRFIPSSLFAA